MNKQMETFLFIPPVNFSEEGDGLLAVLRFENTNFFRYNLWKQ